MDVYLLMDSILWVTDASLRSAWRIYSGNGFPILN